MYENYEPSFFCIQWTNLTNGYSLNFSFPSFETILATYDHLQLYCENGSDIDFVAPP